MSEQSRTEITTLLERIGDGRDDARNQLVSVVYDELREMAQRQMRRERAEHTLQTTALVNEVYLRLIGRDQLGKLQNRRHFFGAAARAMQQVLIDHAKQRDAQKRGRDHKRVPLDDLLDAYEKQRVDVLALRDALAQLEQLHGRQHEIVMLRFYGGLTMPEIAEQLDVSLSTVENDFRTARAWLRGQLGGKSEVGEPQ